MEIRDDLLCLFTTDVEANGAGGVIEIPASEVELGELTAGSTYRVAVFAHGEDEETEERSHTRPSAPTPPVDEGEEIDVEIESIGDQGDGIARVDRGYVIIVPETEVGDRPTVEITTVKENMAFAEVRENHRVA